jgi:hypothetical protein
MNKAQEIMSNLPEGFTVALTDESIFIRDAIVRRKMWVAQGVRPIITITGLSENLVICAISKNCSFIIGIYFYNQKP